MFIKLKTDQHGWIQQSIFFFFVISQTEIGKIIHSFITKKKKNKKQQGISGQTNEFIQIKNIENLSSIFCISHNYGVLYKIPKFTHPIYKD